MAMIGFPSFGVSLAMDRYGWYGVGTRMGSMVLYVEVWTASMVPPDALFVDLLYREGL